MLRSELIKWDYTGIGGEEAVCAAEADAAWSSKRAWSAGVGAHGLCTFAHRVRARGRRTFPRLACGGRGTDES